MLNLSRRVEDIWRTSLVSSKNLRQREQSRLSWWPRFLVSFVKTARFPSRTLVGISCGTSFPSASYMIGFVSGFALHTLRRMVVLPAFALPIIRIRNWGHSARICSALRAPCLTRRSLDDCDSLFAVDIEGEGEECTASVKIKWSEINLWRYHDQEPLLPFLDESRGPGCSLRPQPRDLSSRWPRNRPLHRDLGRPPVWIYREKQARDDDRNSMQMLNVGVSRSPSTWSEHLFLRIHDPFVTLCQDTTRHSPSIASTYPITPTPLSFCTSFPFTLPNVCLPISSTPMATSIPSTV